MKFRIVCLCILISACSTKPQVQIIEGLSKPESIVGDGNNLYISDVGKNLTPTDKDGDGRIVKMSLTGEILDSNICKSPVNAPKGSAIIDGILYVADIDCIRIINLASGEVADSINFSPVGAMFLNDIVAKDNRTLYVSATDQGKVYEVSLSPGRQIKALDIPNIPGINGLDYDAKNAKLAINSMGAGTPPFGKLFILDVNSSPMNLKAIDGVNGIFDGMQFIDDHRVVLTDWVDFNTPSGKAIAVDLKTGKTTALETPVLAGPADCWYDQKNHSLWIPLMVKGSIYKQHLK